MKNVFHSSRNRVLVLIVLLTFFLQGACSGEGVSTSELSDDESYELILRTQYLHELCLVVVPEQTDYLNALYKDSGMSSFDKFMPKNTNRYIFLIDTDEKKKTLIASLNEVQLNEIKKQCKKPLLQQLSQIKEGLPELTHKVEKLYSDFEKIKK